MCAGSGLQPPEIWDISDHKLAKRPRDKKLLPWGGSQEGGFLLAVHWERSTGRWQCWEFWTGGAVGPRLPGTRVPAPPLGGCTCRGRLSSESQGLEDWDGVRQALPRWLSYIQGQAACLPTWPSQTFCSQPKKCQEIQVY